MISFIVEGKPEGKPRPRLTRDGHAYTPKSGREYEQRIRAAWLQASEDERIDGAPVKSIGDHAFAGCELIGVVPGGSAPLEKGDRIRAIRLPAHLL